MSDSKLVKSQKVYSFRGSSYALHPAVMSTGEGGRVEVVHYLSSETYNRFVALANSGRYDVQITGNDSFGWSLRRKAVKFSYPCLGPNCDKEICVDVGSVVTTADLESAFARDGWFCVGGDDRPAMPNDEGKPMLGMTQYLFCSAECQQEFHE